MHTVEWYILNTKPIFEFTFILCTDVVPLSSCAYKDHLGKGDELDVYVEK